MIKHKKWIGKIFRDKNMLKLRHKKIRLDKNERITCFEKFFFKEFISNWLCAKYKKSF